MYTQEIIVCVFCPSRGIRKQLLFYYLLYNVIEYKQDARPTSKTRMFFYVGHRCVCFYPIVVHGVGRVF